MASVMPNLLDVHPLTARTTLTSDVARMQLKRIHHVAIVCSDYHLSKVFYTEILGLRVIAETHREGRQSYKLDLALPDGSQVELFSFVNPPARPSYPEARGLRHLAFEVDDIHSTATELSAKGIAVEQIRLDELTNRRFTFFADPDGLPLEIYEAENTRRACSPADVMPGATSSDSPAQGPATAYS